MLFKQVNPFFILPILTPTLPMLTFVDRFSFFFEEFLKKWRKTIPLGQRRYLA